MPHIRVRGLAFEDLESISDRLIEALAKELDTPADNFTLEYQAVAYLVAGGASSAYPFFDILWFDRGDKAKSNVAQIITERVKPLIDEGKDICVVFNNIKGNDYFENGESFA